MAGIPPSAPVFMPHPLIVDNEAAWQANSILKPGVIDGGKPCVRGLRITVSDVLDYLASGMTEAEILTDFPELTTEDIRACLAFAAERERRLLGSVA